MKLWPSHFHQKIATSRPKRRILLAVNQFFVCLTCNFSLFPVLVFRRRVLPSNRRFRRLCSGAGRWSRPRHGSLIHVQQAPDVLHLRMYRHFLQVFKPRCIDTQEPRSPKDWLLCHTMIVSLDVSFPCPIFEIGTDSTSMTSCHSLRVCAAKSQVFNAVSPTICSGTMDTCLGVRAYTCLAKCNLTPSLSFHIWDELAVRSTSLTLNLIHAAVEFHRLK